MDLTEFENNIGYNFKDKHLLKTALTHTSYAHDNKVESNEKLEYLGDAILEFVISKYLFENYKNLKEGEMTKVRATVVCEDSLYQVAIRHNFSDFLFLGRGEIHCEGNKKPTILADSVEAVIAAIYLDSNIEEVRKFIIENLKQAVEQASKNVGKKDYKTVLQEKLQKNGNVKIVYNILEEKGPDHDKLFIAEVNCNDKSLATGMGKTKKQAEMRSSKKSARRKFWRLKCQKNI